MAKKRKAKPGIDPNSKTQRNLDLYDPLDEDGNPLKEGSINNEEFNSLMKLLPDERKNQNVDFISPQQEALRKKLEAIKQLKNKRSQIEFAVYGHQLTYRNNKRSYWIGRPKNYNYKEALFLLIEDFCPELENLPEPFSEYIFLPAFLNEAIEFVYEGVQAGAVSRKNKNATTKELKKSIEKGLRKHIKDAPRLAKSERPKTHKPGYNHPTLKTLRAREKTTKDSNEKERLLKIIRLFQEIFEITYSEDGDALISKTFANTIARFYMEAGTDQYTKSALFERLKEFENSFNEIDKKKEEGLSNNVFRLIGLKYDPQEENFVNDPINSVLQVNSSSKIEELRNKWLKIDAKGKESIKSQAQKTYDSIKATLEQLSGKENYQVEKVKGKTQPLKSEDQTDADVELIKSIYIEPFRATQTQVGEMIAKKIETHLKKKGHKVS